MGLVIDPVRNGMGPQIAERRSGHQQKNIPGLTEIGLDTLRVVKLRVAEHGAIDRVCGHQSDRGRSNGGSAVLPELPPLLRGQTYPFDAPRTQDRERVVTGARVSVSENKGG